MSIRSSRIAVGLVALGLLLSIGPGAVSSTSSLYRGTLTYGRQTVHINCSGTPAVPTSITYSVPYDATHWNTSAPMTLSASFNYGDPQAGVDPTVYSPSVQEIIQAGQAHTITATIVVPSAAAHLPSGGSSSEKAAS